MNTAGERVEWWVGEVEGIVARLIEEKADAKEKEEAWTWIKDALAPEAVPVAKQLLAEWGGWKKPEPEQVEGPIEIKASFSGVAAKEDDEPPIVSKSSPYDSAQEFTARYLKQD